MKNNVVIVLSFCMLLTIAYNPYKIHIENENNQPIKTAIQALLADVPKTRPLSLVSNISDEQLHQKIRLFGAPRIIAKAAQDFGIVILNQSESLESKKQGQEILKIHNFENYQLILVKYK